MMPRSFSPKQKRVLKWWAEAGEEGDYDALICDGAVRSGKTMVLGLSVFPLGYDEVSGAELCPLRKDGGSGAAQLAGNGIAAFRRAWGFL